MQYLKYLLQEFYASQCFGFLSELNKCLLPLEIIVNLPKKKKYPPQIVSLRQQQQQQLIFVHCIEIC